MDQWYKSIIFANVSDAEMVLSSMQGIIDRNGYVTIGDFYDIIGNPDHAPSADFSGWTSIRGTTIEDTRASDDVDGPYRICFPEPHPLNPKTPEKHYSGAINDGGERISYGEDKADREPSIGKGRYDLVSPYAIRRLARWYELGAEKYNPRNWEKGIPFSRCIDSAKRHLDKFIMGMTDEDHLAAAMWNIAAIIHYEELGMADLDDMPHFENHRTNKERKNEN